VNFSSKKANPTFGLLTPHDKDIELSALARRNDKGARVMRASGKSSIPLAKIDSLIKCGARADELDLLEPV
jgi:hypothetical protein